MTTVDRWPPERIEGHAALTQRIQAAAAAAAVRAQALNWSHSRSWQVIPSHEAVRRNWDRYEARGHLAGSRQSELPWPS